MKILNWHWFLSQSSFRSTFFPKRSQKFRDPLWSETGPVASTKSRNSSLEFVDRNGRVLATSSASDSGSGDRKTVKTVESQLLSGMLPSNFQDAPRDQSDIELESVFSAQISIKEDYDYNSSFSSAIEKLKEISQSLETSGPSLA